jgi:DNA modification methylase
MFSTPKREASANQGRASWYSYYAGFSPQFVRDALSTMKLAPGSRVIDPWNGSGTTTEIAEESGFIGLGYDINPVMVLVAKARLLSSAVKPSHDSLCESILDLANDLVVAEKEEPLTSWFQDKSAQHVRQIEVSIQKVLVNAENYHPICKMQSLSSISSLAAFFYVALFRVVRELADRFVASNPTWLKVSSKKSRLRPARATVEGLFRKHVAAMADAQWTDDKSELAPYKLRETSSIDIGSSVAIPEESQSVDGVISSPPYCTRIDYAIATRVELAVLGFGSIRSLREKMIGTAVITGQKLDQIDAWGRTCNAFLRQMANHRSKASKSYYLKNHLQYFDSLYRSVVELDRVLCPSGQSVLVVQDSFYKDLHNDLPQIAQEMGESVGWRLVDRFNFASNRNMGQVNPNSRLYRDKTPATESVLMFRRRS